MTAVAAVLQFLPPYLHWANWDAFEECIQDLSWLSAPGYVLLFMKGLRTLPNSSRRNGTVCFILTAALLSEAPKDGPSIFLRKAQVVD
ncbi:MAG: barstar family protein [Caldilineaceae bacterium]|nr:barstar family protein [Caldilineaceae bacterium]